MDIAQQILAGQRCQYCHEPTAYVDSIAVYNKSYGMIYWCQPCGAYVGVHQGTDVALGTVADEDLRRLRAVVHMVFDAIWRARISKKIPRWKARKDAYAWVSKSLEIRPEHTHIGMMDESLCQQVIELCRPYYERIKAKERV